MLKLKCITVLLVISILHVASASESLWDELKQGGKVVLIRHAPVERGAEHGNPLIRDASCKRERNLSGQGRQNAESLGKKFITYNIPVSKVMHSPFCRTTETARIAFGKAFPAKYLSLLEILDSDEAARQTEELVRVIASYSGKGNLVLVTHEPNISAISFELLKHLDMLVINPLGDGEFEELGVIRFDTYRIDQ